MIEEQKIVTIDASHVKSEVEKLHQSGYRMVQICCAKVGETIEVNYSFDKDYGFVNLKVVLPLSNLKLQSVSGIYLQALLYENEMHDLFGVEVAGMAIDYKGSFYRTSIKTPFNPSEKKD